MERWGFCKLKILLVMVPLLVAGMFPIALQTVWAQEAPRPGNAAVLKNQTQDLEQGQFQLSLTPCYYKYKGDPADWLFTGLLLRAYLVKNWEISIGSNFLSYQRPDFGVDDIYMGAKWTFYDQQALRLAVSGYLNFPTGSPAFREPGIQPTLAFTITRTTGAFELGATVGTTYAADSQGEPCYFDFENRLEINYTPNKKNAFGIFTYGYTPDQREDGALRLSTGASYTRTFNEWHSASVTFEKGLSGRGLDWSVMFSYDFTFGTTGK
jgi:hypothetical protein